MSATVATRPVSACMPSMRSLGMFAVADEILSISWADGSQSLWLDVVTKSERRKPLGVIHWDVNRSPHLTLSPGATPLVMPHSPLAELMVSRAMAAWRVIGLGETPRGIAPVPISVPQPVTVDGEVVAP